MVDEAQGLRARVLADLARRRKVLHAQIEQLRAGRERLAETVHDVRRSVDVIADELFAAEDNARLAAEAAGREAAARPDEGTPEELAAELLAEEAEAAAGPDGGAVTDGRDRGPVDVAVDVVEVAGRRGRGRDRTGDDAEEPVPAIGRVRSTPCSPSSGPAQADGRRAPASRRPGAAPGAVSRRTAGPATPSGDGRSGRTPTEAGDADGVDGRAARIEPAGRPAGRADRPHRRRRWPAGSSGPCRTTRTSCSTPSGPRASSGRPTCSPTRPSTSTPTPPPPCPPGGGGRGRGHLRRNRRRSAPPGVDALVGIGHELAESVVGPLRAPAGRRRGPGRRRGVGGGRARRVGLPGVEGRADRAAGRRPRGGGLLGRLDRWPPAGQVDAQLEWVAVVHAGDAPCPDCEDNGLNGPSAGEAFPTGHPHPPAHPGCRCLLAISAT